MARAMWSGAISFGLVSIPVKLFNAVSRKSVSFNQLEKTTGSRVKQKLVSGVNGEEVGRDQIVKGYALGGDSYVTISEDELASIMPVAQRTIDLEEFVDLADIDPVFYDSAYYLVPDRAAVKPYALLVDAMETAGKVGIARFVMRSKQYVAALRVREGKLILNTMVYADELNAVDELPEVEAALSVELTEREKAMAQSLIESLSADFEPAKYHDTYREQLMDIIERKAAGESEIVLEPMAEQSTKVVDLLAALEASVAEAKAARKRHPTGLPEGMAEGEDTGQSAATATAKRAPRRKSA
ncbi:MAG: Ku protein [Acidimicrobiales bacterium]